MGRGIPDRWQDYSKIGKQVKDAAVSSRFIAFKVPLKQALGQHVAPNQRFTPSDLVALLRAQNITVGLVIDLTNTSRYYSPGELAQFGISYVKIAFEGHVVPSANLMTRFSDAVNAFLAKNLDEKVLIGVHCTHGVNRTGYAICRYLIDHKNVDPEKAIKAFNTSRGHWMERENYLSHLRTGQLPSDEQESYFKSPPVRNFGGSVYNGQGHYDTVRQGDGNIFKQPDTKRLHDGRVDNSHYQRKAKRPYTSQLQYPECEAKQRKEDNLEANSSNMRWQDRQQVIGYNEPPYPYKADKTERPHNAIIQGRHNPYRVQLNQEYDYDHRINHSGSRDNARSHDLMAKNHFHDQDLYNSNRPTQCMNYHRDSNRLKRVKPVYSERKQETAQVHSSGPAGRSLASYCNSPCPPERREKAQDVHSFTMSQKTTARHGTHQQALFRKQRN